MLNKFQLRSLGFRLEKSNFIDKLYFVLGEEDIEVCGLILRKQPIIFYDIDTQTARVSRGEFCVISRKCETVECLNKFIESISFLFNLTL